MRPLLRTGFPEPQVQSIPAFKVHYGKVPETYTCRLCINDGISRLQLTIKSKL